MIPEIIWESQMFSPMIVILCVTCASLLAQTLVFLRALPASPGDEPREIEGQSYAYDIYIKNIIEKAA